jgi:hypothetical protein
LTQRVRQTDAEAPAAKACNDYSNVGKTNWFLPSKDELNQLYVNRTSVGNMETVFYNSSSQDGYNASWFQAFSDGGQSNNWKNSHYVRAF